jgi:hypothetical protein
MNKYLAYYLRLSLDDGNISDSNSISNQRRLIEEYIYSSDKFAETNALEFIEPCDIIEPTQEAVKMGGFRELVLLFIQYSQVGANLRSVKNQT